jgi:hypothetical protein
MPRNPRHPCFFVVYPHVSSSPREREVGSHIRQNKADTADAHRCAIAPLAHIEKAECLQCVCWRLLSAVELEKSTGGLSESLYPPFE